MMLLLKGFLLFTVYLLAFSSPQSRAESVTATYKRSIQNLEEAEKALASKEDVYKIINLRFFGSYAAMDDYINRLDRDICRGDSPQQILALYPEREAFPYRQRVFSVMTEAMSRMALLSDADKRKLSKTWSYRYFLKSFAKLDCVIAKADNLQASGDPVDRLEAAYVYDAILGFRHANERLQQLHTANRIKAAETIQPLTIAAGDIHSYDIFGVRLGMPIADAIAVRPELVIVEDSRQNNSITALKAIYQKTELKDSTIKLEILFANTEYGAGGYDLDYEIDTTGFTNKQTRQVVKKLFEKYGLPSMDLTEQTTEFREEELDHRLKNAATLMPVFCWGECNRAARSKSLTPGQRLLFSYDPNKHRLSLRLFDNALEPVHDRLKQEWMEFTEHSDTNKDVLVF